MTEAAGDWSELLRRVVERRDDAARGELVARFYPRVQSIVHRELDRDFRQRHKWILPLFSTRDVVQDVFADVVDRLAECDFPHEDGFVAYLATAVRNRLLDAVRFHEAARRDQRRHAPAPRDDDTPDSASGLEALDDPTPTLAASLAEQAAILETTLGELPERKRAILQLRIVEDESFPRIAERLGYSSAETARQAFLDAKARLLVKLRSRGLRPEE